MDPAVTCCFSGHRPARLPWGRNEADPRCLALKARLDQALEEVMADYTAAAVSVATIEHGQLSQSGAWGWAIKNEREMTPDTKIRIASISKVAVGMCALAMAEEGLVDLDAPRTIDPRNRVGGTGILCELGTDYTPSLRDLAKLMIVLSDNIATNEIMDVIGMERFNSFCREMGYQNITLMRKMMDFEAIQQGKNNYMCAGETGRLLSAISRGEFVNPEISQTIFDIMASQQCRNKLPALLPAVASYSGSKSAIPEGQVLVANKTGDLVGIQHDVGIFELPDGRRYLIAMFTGDLENDSAGIAAISQVSLAVYQALRD